MQIGNSSRIVGRETWVGSDLGILTTFTAICNLKFSFRILVNNIKWLEINSEKGKPNYFDMLRVCNQPWTPTKSTIFWTCPWKLGCTPSSQSDIFHINSWGQMTLLQCPGTGPPLCNVIVTNISKYAVELQSQKRMLGWRGCFQLQALSCVEVSGLGYILIFLWLGAEPPLYSKTLLIYTNIYEEKREERITS